MNKYHFLASLKVFPNVHTQVMMKAASEMILKPARKFELRKVIQRCSKFISS